MRPSVIPIAHARALLARAREPKRLVTTHGGHEDAYRVDPSYLAALHDFAYSPLSPLPPL